MKLTQKQQEARKRICLALDVPTVKNAIDLVTELSDYIGLFKIGKQLHTAAVNEGINIIKEIYSRGGNVFLDLKLHDTPNTVYHVSKACAVPGVCIFNIHIAGGKEMCQKAVQGAYEAAQAKGIEKPKVIGVTVLTSLNDEDLQTQNLNISYDELVMRRTELAREWKLDGIVCPANKARELEKKFGSDFFYVTPGIEWAGKQGEGQKQLYTPNLAVRDCSNSILVIGSAITESGNIYNKKKLKKKGTAEDRKKTAYGIIKAMAKEL